MIIGISGKIGSGKDTIAQMIQNRLQLEEDTHLRYSTWEIRKFAGKLKQIASLLTGIPVERFEDQEFKKTSLGPVWNDMTVREFLQRLGTDACRDNIHPNIWVNALFADYNTKVFVALPRHATDRWIITDVRFPNEADAIKAREGILLRINRPTERKDEHPSETALDNYEGFNYVINNDGTLEDLKVKVVEFLKASKFE